MVRGHNLLHLFSKGQINLCIIVNASREIDVTLNDEDAVAGYGVYIFMTVTVRDLSIIGITDDNDCPRLNRNGQPQDNDCPHPNRKGQPTTVIVRALIVVAVEFVQSKLKCGDLTVLSRRTRYV